MFIHVLIYTRITMYSNCVTPPLMEQPYETSFTSHSDDSCLMPVIVLWNCNIIYNIGIYEKLIVIWLYCANKNIKNSTQ